MPSSCSVSVQTWGTDSVSNTGMLHTLDAMMFGGNVGHAAVSIRFPANEEGKELIQKYCFDTDGNIVVPFIRQKASYADGSTEEIYQVRFSWWPESDADRTIEFDINKDRLNERRGVQFNWSDEAASTFAPESRIFKGLLGARTTTLSPLAIEHRRNLGDEEIKKLEAYSKYTALQQELEASRTLLDKFESLNKKKSIKLSKSNLLLLRNVFQGDNLEIPVNAAGDELKKQIDILLPKIKEKINTIELDMTAQKDVLENHTELDELRQEIASLKQLKSHTSYVLNKIKKTKALKKKSSPTLYQDVTVTLDALYPEWKATVKDPESVTPTEKENLIKMLKEKEKDIKRNLRLKETEFKLRINYNYEEYITLGLLEDSNCTLPIKTFPGTTVGTSNGLDVEEMLKKMHTLATDKNIEFDIALMNCSDTVGGILEAGLQQKELKEIAANRAWGAFGNPQMVRNAAMKIQSALYNNGDQGLSTREKFREFNPLQQVAGYLLRIYIDLSNSKPKRYLAAIGSLVFSGLAVGMYLIRGLANPMGVYKDSSHILRYAYNNPSYTLRTVATIFVAPITAIYAIPAFIQISTTNVAQRFTKMLSKPATPPQTSTPLSEEGQKINKQVIDIKDTSPNNAIRKFLNMLRISDATIPVFNIKAMKEIEKLYGNNALLPTEIRDLIKDLPQKFRQEILLANVEFNTLPSSLTKKCDMTADKFAALDPSSKERFLLDNLLTMETLVATLCNLSLKRVNEVYAEATTQRNTATHKEASESLETKSANMIFTKTTPDEKPKEHEPTPQITNKPSKSKKM